MCMRKMREPWVFMSGKAFEEQSAGWRRRLEIGSERWNIRQRRREAAELRNKVKIVREYLSFPDV